MISKDNSGIALSGMDDSSSHIIVYLRIISSQLIGSINPILNSLIYKAAPNSPAHTTENLKSIFTNP
ncbi:hypothetical protein GCM10011506_00500 [Marivirga lumbricoides]|uniref:Uncharacterized protein n=1 Tax=Marivirga lumbricoides TaxID=1046115 RepID=A0A2T4DUD2_9BACT|nr:hypothetical protein C9994_02890 [Marivirga lumbricoides]GGC19341.1 hypothetical protein GCM10011506_00500 [Marivirga lumbricoides]